jgi:hypothetical protein
MGKLKMTKSTVYLGMIGIVLGVTLMLTGCASLFGQREAGENETDVIVEGKGAIVAGANVAIYIDDKVLSNVLVSGQARMIIPNGTHTIQLKEGLFDGNRSNIITFEAVGERIGYSNRDGTKRTLG